jgi:hypothetical protein
MFLGDDASDRTCRTDHRSHDPESMRLRSRVDNAEGAHNDVLQKITAFPNSLRAYGLRMYFA